ncbi:MAG TPA: DUF5615 family PIN-like protein [Tepidiformaceae bacterium]|nr:DUF5615 family PIN-like protein [Tepidiformaceae bacterium]HMO95373.1 DUF5615 family PIN-like protein [Tepidiformaceae bacterium]
MEFLVDAQLPPSLARLLSHQFGVEASHVDELGLRDAPDAEIARWAKTRTLVVISKDEDFLQLTRQGLVPGMVYMRCGNVSNAVLIELVRSTFATVIELLEAGETIVEVTRGGESLPR